MIKKIVSKKIGAGKMLLLLGGAMAGVKILKSRKDSPTEEDDVEDNYNYETYGGDDAQPHSQKSVKGKCSGRKCKKCKCNKCCKAKETKH